jgi:hypothetical protein
MIETSAAQTKLVTLAPSGVAPSRTYRFRNSQASSRRYDELLAKVQRFRGAIYCQDGAISASDLTPDGRHYMPIDERSWHVIALTKDEEVCGCVRYLPENAAMHVNDLWVGEAAIASCPTWGSYFRRAVDQERARARSKGVDFAEVGGWAVAEDRRWTTDPLRMILGVWGLSKVLGGCVGVATATVRHGSAVILRRIGLRSMVADGVELPPYYDPHYGCEMEALRFDSDLPNPKYKNWIEELRRSLEAAPMVCNVSRALDWMVPVHGMEAPKIPVSFPLSVVGQMAR